MSIYIIYGIHWKQDPDTILYVGSTIDMDKRWRDHKCKCATHDYPVYNHINANEGFDNFDYKILEEGVLSEGEIKEHREQYHIEEIGFENLLNAQNAWTDTQEYQQEYQQEYYQKNKEQLNERKKEKITCECGVIVSITHLARHRRSKKHIDWMKTL